LEYTGAVDIWSGPRPKGGMPPNFRVPFSIDLPSGEANQAYLVESRYRLMVGFVCLFSRVWGAVRDY
jgi:hypothetical protein